MKKFIFIFAFAVLSMPMFAFGQCAPGTGSTGQPPCSALGTLDPNQTGEIGKNAFGSTAYDTTKFIATIIGLVNWFSWFIAIGALLMGLYSGWLFITARDNAQQITAAQKTMLYAVIGIGVAIIAFGIIAITKSLLSIV